MLTISGVRRRRTASRPGPPFPVMTTGPALSLPRSSRRSAGARPGKKNGSGMGPGSGGDASRPGIRSGAEAAASPDRNMAPDGMAADRPRTRWSVTIGLALAMFTAGLYLGRNSVPTDRPQGVLREELQRRAEVEQEAARRKLQQMYSDIKKDIGGDPGDWKNQDIPSAGRLGQPEARPAPPPESAAGVEMKRSHTVKPDFMASEARPDRPHGGQALMYAVQVASYLEQRDADDLVTRLRTRGYEGAYRVVENVSGAGLRYRVKIGYFGSRSAARHMKRKLHRDEAIADAYIVEVRD